MSQVLGDGEAGFHERVYIVEWRFGGIEEHALEFGGVGGRVGALLNLGDRAIELFRAEGIDPESVDDVPGEFTELLADSRTNSPGDRYDKEEALEERFKRLLKIAQSTIPNPRIQARIIKMLNLLIESIRQGEDIRKLRQADIARKLEISTSTLGEDISRLRSAGESAMQDASVEEFKS